MTILYNEPYGAGRWRGSALGAVDLVLGIWLFVSPWVLGFVRTHGGAAGDVRAAGAAMATWNAWILGALLAIVALTALARLRLWQDHIALVFGAWIFAAPWVLGFNPWVEVAAWDHWITGLLVFLMSTWALPAVRSPI